MPHQKRILREPARQWLLNRLRQGTSLAVRLASIVEREPGTIWTILPPEVSDETAHACLEQLPSSRESQALDSRIIASEFEAEASLQMQAADAICVYEHREWQSADELAQGGWRFA